MWSYIKVPWVPGENSEGSVLIVKLYVREGDVIESGALIAAACTKHTDFSIVSNYAGRILKLHTQVGALAGYRSVVATLELHDDPIDGLWVERMGPQPDS